MSLDKSAQPRGSLILKLIILLLLGLLLFSILYPHAQWKKQAVEQGVCRLRMENLLYATREFAAKNARYSENLNDYLEFIRDDSVLFETARYDVESLVRDTESGKDSLLLDFTDEFHLAGFRWDFIRPDSVVIRAMPHPEFSDIPVTLFTARSAAPIKVEERRKNVQDHAVLIYADSRIDYQFIYPDPVPLKATEAILSLPVADLRECPVAEKPYKIHINIRALFEGTVNFTVYDLPVSPNITQDSLILDLFNHRLKTEALGEVLIAVKEDSALIAKKDSILFARFLQAVAGVKSKQTYDVNGDYTTTMPVDSLGNWNHPQRIRRAVFVTHVDSLSLALKHDASFLALAPRIGYTETYRIAKVDTIGVTIQCPLDSLYHPAKRSIIYKIFGVGTPPNHGSIENGDLSWSEKR
jgi:hypothetical protein